MNARNFKTGSMLNRTLIALATGILFCTAGKSQDAEFSQFYANPLYLNPALAGAEDYHRAAINYRNQWPGLNKGFVTYNASYDQFIEKLHGGVGVLLNVDNAGDGMLKTTQVSLIYAYTLKVSYSLFINMAMQGTFYQKSLNWELYRYGDQFDLIQGTIQTSDEAPPESSSIYVADFSAGLTFGWKGVIHGGVAVNHLTQPNLAFYSQYDNELPMKITGHFGLNINPNGEGMMFDPVFYISPNILYQQQGNFHQVNAGLYITYVPIVFGTWFRHNFENSDAMIFLVGINYKGIKIGYSFDLGLSEISNITGGAHEISIAWLFGKEPKLRHVYPLNAPGF